jgi:Na+/H+-dicarboxylate symporter
MELFEDLLPILFSVFVGGIIGIEREYQLKSAGLRTMILVTLGACIFTMLSIGLGEPGSPDRIAAISLPESDLWEQGLFLKKITESPALQRRLQYGSVLLWG